MSTFREQASFEVVHAKRAWPWVSCAGERVAYASATELHVRSVDGAIASFPLPPAATMFALAPDAPRVAVATPDALIVGETEAPLRALLGDATLSALTFDRTGKRLWLSAETATETVVVLADASSLEVAGTLRSAAFPRPSLHEIHIHPQDDAALILAACGESGTFARVVGFAGAEVSAIPTALDEGGIAAGFVGFSGDGARVHLVEADELRTHAWPTLHELSSVPLADDFVSSFSGAVFGHEIFVDGEWSDTQEDAVMQFDRAAIHGIVLKTVAPLGMWAGRLGANALVTIEPARETRAAARGHVYVRTADGKAPPGAS